MEPFLLCPNCRSVFHHSSALTAAGSTSVCTVPLGFSHWGSAGHVDRQDEWRQLRGRDRRTARLSPVSSDNGHERLPNFDGIGDLVSTGAQWASSSVQSMNSQGEGCRELCLLSSQLEREFPWLRNFLLPLEWPWWLIARCGNPTCMSQDLPIRKWMHSWNMLLNVWSAVTCFLA